MEDWVYRALAKWPNVPAVFGWMGLDRRGRWLIRGEPITRPQIIDTINRNYAVDGQGRWFFQNGPQRGYVSLEYAPLILRTDGAGKLKTHTEVFVERPNAAFLDEHGALTLDTEHGPGVLDDEDLGWALDRLTADGGAIGDNHLADALALNSGHVTALQLDSGAGAALAVTRMDASALPAHLGFVREPRP
jgi:hypothetical protein